jgi:acyl carrier protein
VQAEDALGIRVDDSDLAGLRTVSDAANYLQDRTAPAVR